MSDNSPHSEVDLKGRTEYRDGRDVEALPSRIGDGDLGHQARTIEERGFYKRVGNPGLLGLAAHAVTLMLLSTQFMTFRGVSTPAVYVGNLFFFAGLYMFTTCQWCLVKGETFASTVFGVFSGFYLSYGAILTPAFNVAASFTGDPGSANSTATQYESLATFLWVWNGAFMCIFLASLRTNAALVIVFFGVIMGVWLLASMYSNLAVGATDKALKLSKAGGAFLFLSACSGFYLVVVQISESVDMPFTLPVGDLAPLWPKKKKSA
ncbi:GPR1/FUN34/yaaH family-domain-containing protein [Leucosporidium creatinivorum]|uniref:GPR1/FUN34/yaaH family-domain-containing protein n=1 Tax=Leucosporidium creatinivorum TaxID=106004 RepID=A0A1Y2DZF6_9BASI|nr:GPR1/FUN34/yaaH family-domain-containing protein [Leucosporidium creatinivorum]